MITKAHLRVLTRKKALAAAAPSIQTTTWNPADPAGASLTNGNLTLNSGGTSWDGVRSTTSRETTLNHDFYWEALLSGAGISSVACGVCTASLNLTGTPTAWTQFGHILVWPQSGDMTIDTTSYTDVVEAGNNVIYRFLFTPAARQLSVAKEGGAWSTPPAVIGLSSDPWFVVALLDSISGGEVTANFGATPFTYSIPSGAYSWDGSQQG